MIVPSLTFVGASANDDAVTGCAHAFFVSFEQPCFYSLWSCLSALDHFRCQRDDLHVVLAAQFTSNWSEDTGTAWVAVTIDQNNGVESNFT